MSLRSHHEALIRLAEQGLCLIVYFIRIVLGWTEVDTLLFTQHVLSMKSVQIN